MFFCAWQITVEARRNGDPGKLSLWCVDWLSLCL